VEAQASLDVDGNALPQSEVDGPIDLETVGSGAYQEGNAK
jgi:hypothetical protein